MRAAAGRPSAAKNARRAPNLVAGGGRLTRVIASGEIVGSNKERIVVNHLSAGRLVVGVVEPDQSVPQKGSEQGVRLGQFGGAAGRFDDFDQIGPHLQGGVAVAV